MTFVKKIGIELFRISKLQRTETKVIVDDLSKGRIDSRRILVPPGREYSRKMKRIHQSIAALVFLAGLASGYPSWLKCYIEFDDEEEIIMNSPIVPLEKAGHQVDILVSSDDGETWTKDNLEFSTEDMTTFLVRFDAPEALRYRELHYILEVRGRKGAVFERGSCDGRRIHGTLAQQATLVVNGSSEGEDADEAIELIGGWAAGHEAVKLTSVTTLHPEEQEL